MGQKTTVLLVEDNHGHAFLIQEEFRRHNGDIDFHQVSTGEAAFKWLEVYWPHVILLDLNLPGIYGLEVLKRLKVHEQLKKIPVVILTTSQSEADIIESYKSQAACYIIKPVNYEKWSEAIGHISGLYKMGVKVLR